MENMKNTLLVFAAILLTGITAHAQEDLQIGDMAPEFCLKNVDGRMISLSNYDDRSGVILIFTCNHCPYSLAYENRILDLDKQYAPQGFPVVAINPNDPKTEPEDSFGKMIERAQEKDFSFPYLFDNGQKIYAGYGATCTPQVFLLENKGRYFEVVYIGAIDDNYRNEDYVEEKYLENALTDIINGKKVFMNFTKAIGCNIKSQK